jgi:response regulator of citrate/malate metabolism
VILVSRVTDTYLWEEVVRMGGFDVVAKPFRKDTVEQVLTFALNHWKTGWTLQYGDLRT